MRLLHALANEYVYESVSTSSRGGHKMALTVTGLLKEESKIVDADFRAAAIS